MRTTRTMPNKYIADTDKGTFETYAGPLARMLCQIEPTRGRGAYAHRPSTTAYLSDLDLHASTWEAVASELQLRLARREVEVRCPDTRFYTPRD